MNKFNILYQFFVIIGLGVILLTSCETNEQEVRMGGEYDVPITEYLDRETKYSYLVELLEATDLHSTIGAYNPSASDGKYTLFAPTNDAIERFITESEDYASYEAFKADTAYVREVLLMHALDGSLVQNSFSIGAQSKSTLSKQRLTFVFDEDVLKFKINTRALIVSDQIELGNGYVHEIDALLLPFDKTALTCLQENDEYSLFTSAMVATHIYEGSGEDDDPYVESAQTLADILDVAYDNPEERLTVFAITNEEYASNGIETVEDLKAYAVSHSLDEDLDPSEFEVEMYKLMGMHIIEGNYYHVDFTSASSGYSTINSEILRISNASFVKLLEGVDVFDTIIEGEDTTEIDYITLNLNKSNVSSQTAVIHEISDILQLTTYTNLSNYYRSDPRYDEDVLALLYTSWTDIIEDSPELEESFYDDSTLDNISYTGDQAFSYNRMSNDYTNALANDFMMFDGFFEMTYTTENELSAGIYDLYIKGAGSVVVDIYVDGKLAKMRFSINRGLTQFTLLNSSEPIPLILEDKEQHTITVRTVTPGTYYLDFYRFDLVKSL